LEERDASERKRKREQEIGISYLLPLSLHSSLYFVIIDLEQKRKTIKEKEETWEKGREDRVSSWRSFATNKGKKAVGELKPPKLKQTK
jgi:hypothetical protein